MRALNTPAVHDRLTGLGADPIGNTSEQYAPVVRSEIDKWGKVIKGAAFSAVDSGIFVFRPFDELFYPI